MIFIKKHNRLAEFIILVSFLMLFLNGCTSMKAGPDNTPTQSLQSTTSSNSDASLSNLPKEFLDDLIPVMDRAEDVTMERGMNYSFYTYRIKEKLENVTAFYIDRLNAESDFKDNSISDLLSIAFEKDGKGVIITAEPETSKKEYILVNITITPDERN